MAVLNALKQTPGALWRNPVLLIPVLALVILQAPMFAAEFIDPIFAVVMSVGFSLVFIVLMPYFQGGIVGMAEEALSGKTSIKAFFEAGKSNYISIFGAYLLIIAINVVMGIGFVLFTFFGIGAAYLSGDVSSVAPILVVAGGGLLIALAYFTFVFFIQFYSQAIVLDGVGAVDGIKRSYSVVRSNLAATFGYSILVGAIGGIFGLLISVVSILASPRTLTALNVPTLPIEWLVAIGGISGVLTLVIGTFLAVYSVSFYEAIANPIESSTT